MSFKTTLQKALAASCSQEIDSYSVEEQFSALSQTQPCYVTFCTSDDEQVEIDVDQEITVTDGCATVVDAEGGKRQMSFTISRPLAAEDL